MVEQTYKASKLAFSDINRNQKLGRSPRSPYAGVATGLSKTPRTHTDKNDTALIPVLNTLKITTLLILDGKVSRLNTHSTTALDTGMQRQDKTYVATRKLSVRMPIALPMQK